MNKTSISNNSIDFLNEISNFIIVSKYARYDEKLQRRETWNEIVNRLEHMHLKKYHYLSEEDKNEIRWAFSKVREKLVVPSMRSLQFGGKAIEKHNARMYNCAVRHVDSLRSFSEIFYLLLCGCGVGIGLSKKYLSRLPDLVNKSGKTGTVITYVVEDSIEGWADSVEALLNCYFKNTPYTGRKIIFDYSKIRPKGVLLKTTGGKAPGYKGLKNAHIQIKNLLDYIIEVKHQTRLKPINAYDILMHCADAVLSGGIRRSATSVIFDKDDEEMIRAKTSFEVIRRKGTFEFDDKKNCWIGKVSYDERDYEIELSEYEYKIFQETRKVSWTKLFPWRARSNNSVLLLRNLTTLDEFKKIVEFTKEWGEPGFVWANSVDVLFNPCFEIGFIPVTEDGQCGVQFCNLTSLNGRMIKTKEDFRDAVKAQAIIGTLQAGYTDFPYLSNVSKKLTEEEALLGCSMTGVMDSPEILLNYEYQKEMAKYAVQVNKEWAKKIGINQAARVTTLKPEGTSSLVLGCASGIHPHHYKPYYFRRVQCNKLDNVYKFFKKHNPHMCEESVWSANKTDDVVTFPIRVSDNAIVKSDLTAIRHLEIIKNTQINWVLNGISEVNKKPVNHNISCTVIVKDNEWNDVINYVYLNREYFTAISFLPEVGDKLYPQAPMEKVITEEDYKKLENIIKNYKLVDYTKLIEKEDETHLQEEISCAGGLCEIIQI